MADKNEMVTIELATSDRLRLNNQIVTRMQRLGYKAHDWNKLNLGFELPPGWPIDMHAQPTLAQLTVVAHKLKMCIVINDLNMVPLREKERKNEFSIGNDRRLPG